ncbi:sugar phosphate isomerase/epimerase [Ruminococcus sp. OA3]|uniref:sugar phosphate isomerase/epimerase family protein n=1 Tax=Ruminococcus sp. OA3 TaxID=2914164 RepID=UPI001F063CC1|nr:sugar phosphate isomerase/epimerase family protein [Ruminococcus sp. OA3]MCH1981350.1 sugar phosphate isomerase/epimerase [Ruminococcus sp. OA3]
MREYCVGVNLPPSVRLENLDGYLRTIEENGFNACELNLSTYPFMMGGNLIPCVAEYVREIFAGHPLTYTAHGAYGLDLRNPDKWELRKKVLFASIDLCSSLGCTLLNIHNEEDSKKSSVERLFRTVVKDAAEYAKERGVSLVLENIEIENVYRTIDMVESIDHDNLGMNLDLGHLFLSSQYYGYDYLKAVTDSLPRLRHLHIHDNMGEFEAMRLTDFNMYKTLDKKERMVFSSGDMHTAPFWGKAPLQEAIKAIKHSGYQGVWLCEYYSDLFAPFNTQICQSVRNCIEQA